MTITNGDLGSDKVVTVSEGDVDNITGFTDGATITITGMLEDYAKGAGGTGNQTVGSPSSVTLEVDQTDPASPTIASITTVGDPVVAAIWNADNTAATVVVNIANDASLNGGKVQILAKKNGGSYEGIGNSVALSGRDINGTTSVTLTAAHIEGVDSGVTEGDVLTFKAKIYDAAGNHTTGNAFGTTLTIDQRLPTVTRVTSDDDDTNPLGIGDELNIKVLFDENVTVDVTNGTPFITLDLNNAPGSENGNAVYQSGSGSQTLVFKYQVVANNYSTDVNYESTNSLDLNRGTIRDAAGNTADTRFPGTSDSDALAVYNNKDFWIDGVVPADNTTDEVLTVGTTQKAGYWNASNTSATVKVLLSNSDISLIGGSVQIQAKADANNNFANVGASSTITSAEQTAGFKTMTLTAAQIEGLAGYSDQASNPDIISFKAIVTDKAGNSTTHAVSNTTPYR
ncbi:hypothetical protein CM15mP37_10180 [bacterium]|nr:MAG: hypothetical protein CM15mP37_10180 [bacterium]